MSNLSDLLRDRNLQGLSAREIGRRAEKDGHALSQSSAIAIMGGRHGLVTDELLEGFAAVLPVTVEELREAQGLPADTGTPWEPPSDARYLTPAQRTTVAQIIKWIVSKEGAQDGRQPEDQKIGDTPPTGGPIGPGDKPTVDPGSNSAAGASAQNGLGRWDDDGGTQPAGARGRSVLDDETIEKRPNKAREERLTP